MFLLNGVSMYPEVGLRPAEEYISSGTSHGSAAGPSLAGGSPPEIYFILRGSVSSGR